jgi:hypothetical protein
MSKKAQNNPFLILFLVIMIAVLIYGLVLVGGTMKEFTVDYNSQVQISSSSAMTKEISNTNDSRLNTWLDSTIFFVVVFLWLGCIFLGSQFNQHPAMFIMLVIGLIFVLVVVANFEDMYQMFLSDDAFNDFPTYFPITNWLITNLTLVCMVIGGSIIISFVANIGGYL